jgi:hypothetical protein
MNAKGDGQMGTQQSLKRASAARRCNEEVIRSRWENRSETFDAFLRRLVRRSFSLVDGKYISQASSVAISCRW